jgi:hypothetical protein
MIESLIGELYFDVELYDSIEFGTKIRIGEYYNGSACIVKRNGTQIIGQLETSISFTGSLIQLNNGSVDQWVRYLNAELVGRRLQINGPIIYTNDAAFHAVRLDAQTGTKANYSFEYADGEEFAASFIPTNLSDNALMGDKQSSTFSLVSSGAVARIEAG